MARLAATGRTPLRSGVYLKRVGLFIVLTLHF